AGVAGGKQETVEDLWRVHGAFVPTHHLGGTVRAILALLVRPVALDIVILHPFAVRRDHLFPTRGLCKFGVGHTAYDVEVRLDVIFPSLSLVDALLFDAERS